MKIRQRYIPPIFIITGAMFSASVVLLLLASTREELADFVNETVCHTVRRGLSFITSYLSVSVFELLLYLAPTLVMFAVALGIARLGDKVGTVRFLCGLLSVIFLFFSLYILSLGIAYRTPPLQRKLRLEHEEVNAESLYVASTVLLSAAEPLLDEIAYLPSGSSEMPYSLDTLSEKICRAYDAVAKKYEIIENFDSRAKPIYASGAMSYLELLGIYSPTGEANVNVDYPDYNLPFTVAHEFAHQRGIAREDEANFVAFLVCMATDDPYIRYSGCLNMYVYVSNALYRTDRSLYMTLLSTVDERLLGELRAEREYTARYDVEWIGEASSVLNDTYLKMNGTEGVISYELVVRLLISYFNHENGEI